MHIVIGTDFSSDPSGRYYTDGTSSGEQFREEVLKPSLESCQEVITIDLDTNIEGYGSSFLVGAFSGLVKYGYFTKEQLIQRLKFVYKDEDFEFYVKKIQQYINDAQYKSATYVSTKAQ